MGTPALLCSPVLSGGESGGWPGSGGWLGDIWLRERELSIVDLRGDPPIIAECEGGRLGLPRWLLIKPWWLLPSDWLPTALRGEWVGPFRTILVSNWSQMGRVAGDWIDMAGRFPQSLLLLPGPPTDVALLCRALLALGGGGGGGVEDKDLCRWGA